MSHSGPGSSPPRPAVEREQPGGLDVVLQAPGADLEQYNNSRSAHPVWSSGRWAGPYSTYGLNWRAAVARRQGVIVGQLPLVHQRSLLFGSRTVSLPWVDAAGLTADSPEVANALVQAALGEMRQAGTTRLDLRQETPLFDWPVERDDKLAMQLELAADPEVLWKRFDPKVRNQVRKAEKSGIVVETNPPAALARFYAVYSQNMRDLGSPPHSLAFFERVLESFSDAAAVHVARLGEQAVGVALTIRNGDRLDIPWASSLQEYNRFCVNHGLYWHILQHACRTGHNLFYFGRSTRNSGPHQFKRQWGSVEVPLFWYGLDRTGRPLISSAPPKESFGLAIRAWRRLPLGVARWLGPKLISRLQ
ncbi:MAG: GNAT family N-acetyltransferase [Planctomycetaceae bacterium]